MAIAEHASTPAPVPTSPGTGTGNATTASFSPPASSLLLAMVAGGYGSSTTGVTVTDSGAHTWTVGAVATGTGTNKGVSKIYYCYLPAGATSITVTAAYTGLSGGRLLDVRVLTGTASDQSTAANASNVRATASTAGTLSVTPTTEDSRVYGISEDPDTAATYTANGSTTLLTNYNNTTDGVRLVSWRATATTGSLDVGSPATFGGTWGSAQTSNVAAFEVLPAGPPSSNLAGTASLTAGATIPGQIGEDPSAPPAKTATGAPLTITCNAFSPPAGSLLVALLAGGGTGGTLQTSVVTDSGSHSWTAGPVANANNQVGGSVRISTCYLSSAPGSITVTGTFNVSGSGGAFLAVLVLTNTASNQSGAGSGSQVQTSFTATGTVSITTTTAKSRVYGLILNPDYSTANYTLNAATSLVSDYVNTPNTERTVAWKAVDPTATPGATTLGGTWDNTSRTDVVALEILPVPVVVYQGAATLTSTSALGAGATRVKPGAATLTGDTSLSGGASLGAAAAASMAGSAGLTAGALLTQPTGASLAAGSAFTAAATTAKSGAAVLTGVAALTAPAALGEAGIATLAGTAAFGADAWLTEKITVTLTGVADIATDGTRVHPGTSQLAGIAALTAAGVPGSGATLLATATLTAVALQDTAAALSMTGVATFTGPAWIAQRATITVAGIAVLATNISGIGAATLPAVAGLVATATVVSVSGVTFAAVATLTPTPRLAGLATVAMSGGSVFTATAFRIAGGIGVLFSASAALRAGATVITPGQVLAVTFWALNNDGTYNVALPDVASWQLSLVESSPGAVTLDYPTDGRNFSVLRDSVTADRDLLVAIWVGGRDPGSLRAILNTAEGDDVTESGVWRFSGNFLNIRMEEARVAPRTTVVSPPTGPDPTEDLAALRVYAATAGTVMATLIQEAHTRGALADITYIFTGAVDSQGVPWSKTITLKIAPGTDYLTVLTALGEALMCEWEIVDHELVLWEYGTRGVDYTTTTPPIILRAGDTLTESPRKHTVRDAGTTLTVAGGEGLYTEVSDATALARRGRRIEQYISQGSLTDAGSLSAYATAKLPTITAGAMEVGGGIALTGTGPEPLIVYRNGDWVWYDTGLGLERLRIKQLTVSGDANGVLTAGLSLNDLIADQLEQLARRLAGIEGGTTITGTSNASPVEPPVVDTIPPAAPAGLVVDSLAQPSVELVPRSAVFASWSPVTTNADTTAISDLSGYIVQWRYTNVALPTNWVQLTPVTTANADWGDVVAGEIIEVRVAAFDFSGNTSGWSVSAFETTQTDLAAPPVPSTPTASEFLGTLTLTWDGLGSAGEVMPADFEGVQIHRSTTTGFTPGPTTFVENMLGPGSRNYPDLPYGVTQFFKLISYDRTGNLSVASSQASATPAPIGYGHIAFSDPGNLVEDGSFEVSTSRATHTARSDAAWSFVTGGADHGSWFVRGSGAVGSGLRPLVLSPLIPTTPGSDYAVRWAMRATGVNGDVSMRIRWVLATTTTDTIVTFTPGFSSSWTATEQGGGTFTAPAGAIWAQVIVMLHTNCTAGTWDLDRVEVRETVGTLLVRDLAVTDAQIASASVGKLTAGTVTAVMLMAGLLRSGTTGLRYELDANGLRFYDSSDNVTIDLNRASGSATITGTVQTGLSPTPRITVDGPSGEIRFYIDALRYTRMRSYVPPGYSGDVAVELQSLTGVSAGASGLLSRIHMVPDRIMLAVDPAATSPTNTYSQIEMAKTFIDIGLFTGSGGAVQSGGFMNIFGSTNIGCIATGGATRSEMEFRGNGTVELWGKFANFPTLDADECVFIGFTSVNITAGSLAISYGATLLTSMIPVFSLDGTPARNRISANSHTGFTISWEIIGTGSYLVYWHAIRTG